MAFTLSRKAEDDLIENLIVYMTDDNNDIFIIRIRHGHEDWQSNL
ncbi:MAG: hypothetical protein Q9M14_02975 [Mariprofundaceae bacterium]|nr:hypothetical protein [Mariprofundaceae bacterium]